MNCCELANALVPHVLRAGQAIMGHYRQGCVVSTKDGGSPVTAADEDAEALLLDALLAIAPGVTVVAEEMMEGKSATDPGREFFLVDALDGTREFINGRDEFTINIGLIRDQVPCFGIVYAPALSLLYATSGSDTALAASVPPDADIADLTKIDFRRLRTRPFADDDALTISASRSHHSEALEVWLRGVNVGKLTNVGSSLKFCQVAEGKADVYPRFGATREWDTAAGHAILSAAGGIVTKCDGSPFLYGKHEADFVNPTFIATPRRLERLYVTNAKTRAAAL
jgi:3'(2'), 5'-bisphosphate nucleotidase